MVATDHAPHTDEEKAMDLEAAPAGSPGVQTLYLACLQVAKELGNVWLAPRWVCEGPAALAGLQDRKGAIAPGFDADLVIVDPKRKTKVRAQDMRSRQRHGALEGMQFDFSIKDVLLRGESVLRSRTPRGRMIRPALVPR